MTSVARLRETALALPQVEEGTHFGMVAFFVRGKGFASVTIEGMLQLRVTDEDTETCLARHPTGERLVRTGKPIGFRVRLADITGQDLPELVRTAWRSRAPKRLVREVFGDEEGKAPLVGDLPAAIGKPATRALLGAGITTLADAADHSEAELLALHGVGPKAIRILAEAVERQGGSLR